MVSGESARIRLGWPELGEAELAEVAEVLESGMLTMGPKVAEFESLIAGICERNRADAVDSFYHVQDAPEFFEALAGLARYHLVDRTDDEVSICAEIMAESRRHPDIRQLYQTIENDIRDRMAAMLQRAAERGEIRADLDTQAVAGLLMAIGDGMSWRRSVDPKFSAEEALPLILNMVHGLLAVPKQGGGSDGAQS